MKVTGRRLLGFSALGYAPPELTRTARFAFLRRLCQRLARANGAELSGVEPELAGLSSGLY
jgi:hypothetical protein